MFFCKFIKVVVLEICHSWMVCFKEVVEILSIHHLVSSFSGIWCIHHDTLIYFVKIIFYVVNGEEDIVELICIKSCFHCIPCWFVFFCKDLCKANFSLFVVQLTNNISNGALSFEEFLVWSIDFLLIDIKSSLHFWLFCF